MPLQSLLQAFAFGPEDTKVICEAFDSAWLMLQRSGVAYTDGSEVRLREILAKRILASAQSGVLHRLKLADDGVDFVLEYMGKTKASA